MQHTQICCMQHRSGLLAEVLRLASMSGLHLVWLGVKFVSYGNANTAMRKH